MAERTLQCKTLGLTSKAEVHRSDQFVPGLSTRSSLCTTSHRAALTQRAEEQVATGGSFLLWNTTGKKTSTEALLGHLSEGSTEEKKLIP